MLSGGEEDLLHADYISSDGRHGFHEGHWLPHSIPRDILGDEKKLCCISQDIRLS